MEVGKSSEARRKRESVRRKETAAARKATIVGGEKKNADEISLVSLMPQGLSFLLSDATKALKSTRDALRREEMRAASAARGRTSARKKTRSSFALTAAAARERQNGGGGRTSVVLGDAPSLAEFVVKTCLVLFTRHGTKAASDRQFFALMQNYGRRRTFTGIRKARSRGLHDRRGHGQPVSRSTSSKLIGWFFSFLDVK